MANATLHLTNAYHDESGGIRTMYHALLDRAEQDGRRMTLAVPGPADRVDVRGRFTRIVHIKSPRSVVVDRRYRLLLPHRFLFRDRGPLWRLLDFERPDILDVCDKYSLCYFAGLVRRRRKPRPTLVGLSCERMDDNIRAFVSRSGLAATRTFLGRVYIGMFDAHIANSAYTAAELQSAMCAKHARPVFVCPMGVDPLPLVDADRVSRLASDLAARTGGARGQYVVYAGRLSPEKHVDLLPAIMSHLLDRSRPVHLIVAGDGPSQGALRERASLAAPGRVHFLGHLKDRRDLAALLSLCDAFLHPNHREPFGIGPLEAMAAGLPVIAPALGGVLAYATHENAWLAEPTVDGFVRAIHACLDDEGLREVRRRAALDVAARYSWKHATAGLFRRYDAIHQHRLSKSISARVPSAVASGDQREHQDFRAVTWD